MKSTHSVRMARIRASHVLVLGVVSLIGQAAIASAILPGYDLLSTPPGGGVLDLSGIGGPAAFPLVGRPIGPGNTDTIVQRFGTLPPAGTGIIPAELVSLSLESIAPAPLGSSFFDVFVDLDPSFTSPGQINITTHLEPIGGLFNSTFTVHSRVTFTEVGNPSNQFQAFRTDTISSTGSQWSHFAPPGYPNVPAYPSGGFYPGAVGGSPTQASTAVGITHTGPHPRTDPAQMSDSIRIFDPQLDPPNLSKDFQMDETNGEPMLAAFYGPVNAPNQWILFKEPTGQDSDRLMVRSGFLYFQSDPLGPLFGDLPPNPNFVVVENGLYQTVNQFLIPNANYTFPRIDVFSDLNIPEPCSLALLMIGGVITGFLCRGRRA